MKNKKLKTTIKLKKKQSSEPMKYTEDLLKEDEIDVCAVLSSNFKNPIQTQLAYKWFALKVFLKEQKQKIKFFFKKLIGTDK
jgi:hypothetical protein